MAIPKSTIAVDLGPIRQPPTSIPDAVYRAVSVYLNAPIPVDSRGRGLRAGYYPRREWWLEVAHRVAHEVRWWGKATGRQVDVRRLGKDDVPSEGISIESTNGYTLDGFLLYVLTWDAEACGLVLRPVSRAAQMECEPTKSESPDQP